MALPMPHPPFSLHAVSLYPWQPMISFSPRAGSKASSKEGSDCMCVCDFDIETEREEMEEVHSI